MHHVLRFIPSTPASGHPFRLRLSKLQNNPRGTTIQIRIVAPTTALRNSASSAELPIMQTWLTPLALYGNLAKIVDFGFGQAAGIELELHGIGGTFGMLYGQVLNAFKFSAPMNAAMACARAVFYTSSGCRPQNFLPRDVRRQEYRHLRRYF